MQQYSYSVLFHVQNMKYYRDTIKSVPREADSVDVV